ncbi:hypothetical protein [Nocardiopsis flavescens]|uniref:hypothetical protein n=1 Tax=Nocardiopsis flavescens TaxID=758803 RepID=UPI000934C28B|nr:hypothetical protein [Nocardiopsis flavescens]
MREPEAAWLGYWKKHQKPDGQKALEELDAMGWKIENPPKYYTVKCPCGSHARSVHLTPSNPGYFQESVRWAKRQTCMNEEEGQ